MGSLPPRARFFAGSATIAVISLTVFGAQAASGATTGQAASQRLHLSTVQGTDGPDRIITKRYGQRVVALAGDDYVRLGSSNDVAFGGYGNDWLHGNDGRDAVYGGPGNDHPQGGPGNDYVSGGGGDDELDGDRGDDLIFAGAGNDEVTGDEGDDVIYPGPGADQIYGEEGMNKIIARDDGVRDDIFCNMINVGSPPGTIVYIGHRDPLDALRNCKVIVRKR
jgi:Ca2+-binding RTX toxin-like protein